MPEPTREILLKNIDLNEVIFDVQAFNVEFDIEDLDAKFEAFMDEKEAAGEPDIENQALLSVSDERIKAFETVKRSHSTMLARVGLCVDLVPTGIQSTYCSYEELYFSIADGTKFIEYLKALNSSQHSNSQVQGVREVVLDLRKQLELNYDLLDPNESRVIELLAHISRLKEELQRFEKEDLGRSIEELGRYEALLETRCVREVILATRAGLMNPDSVVVQCDGSVRFERSKDLPPCAKWHTSNVTVQEYSDLWEKAVQALEKIPSDDFRGFKDTVVDAALNALKLAKNAFMMQSTDEDEFSPAEEFLIVVDEVFAALSSDSFEVTRLIEDND